MRAVQSLKIAAIGLAAAVVLLQTQAYAASKDVIQALVPSCFASPPKPPPIAFKEVPINADNIDLAALPFTIATYLSGPDKFDVALVSERISEMRDVMTKAAAQGDASLYFGAEGQYLFVTKIPFPDIEIFRCYLWTNQTFEGSLNEIFSPFTAVDTPFAQIVKMATWHLMNPELIFERQAIEIFRMTDRAPATWPRTIVTMSSSFEVKE